MCLVVHAFLLLLALHLSLGTLLLVAFFRYASAVAFFRYASACGFLSFLDIYVSLRVLLRRFHSSLALLSLVLSLHLVVHRPVCSSQYQTLVEKHPDHCWKSAKESEGRITFFRRRIRSDSVAFRHYRMRPTGRLR